MNFVIIMSDSFRRDFLGAYGDDWVHTPSLDKLAKESMVFDRYYVGSFPTLPNRSDLFSGNYTFFTHSWGDFPKGIMNLALHFGMSGYVTQMINDTPHLVNGGHHYDRGFMGWEWVRGQEIDRHMTVANEEVEFPCSKEKLRFNAANTEQHLRNNFFRQFESDWTTAQVFNKACDWLEYNYKRDFLLWLDVFDPHESWDPPAWLVDRYYPNYEGEKIITPPYGPCGDMTKDEIRYSRAAYAGECTLVDKYVGILMRKLEELQIEDDTVVVFMTDHGFCLGEHGLMGKGNREGPFPYFEEVVHIPLFVRIPGKRARARSGVIVQPVDIMPTLLDLAGLKVPPEIHGRSFKSVLEGKTNKLRSFAPMSGGLFDESHINDRMITVTTARHSLLMGPADAKPQLYDLREDPRQKKNIFNKNKDVAKRIQNMFRTWLDEVDFDLSQIDRICF
ncbi:sulfatase [Candidatus Hydrogenedentota bacterium]